MPLRRDAMTEGPKNKLLTQNPLNVIFTVKDNNKTSNFQLKTKTTTEFGIGNKQKVKI